MVVDGRGRGRSSVSSPILRTRCRTTSQPHSRISASRERSTQHESVLSLACSMISDSRHVIVARPRLSALPSISCQGSGRRQLSLSLSFGKWAN